MPVPAVVILIASLLCQSGPPVRTRADIDAAGILALAIRAAGGLEALQNARVVSWRGRATVREGERTIPIEGRWRLEPHDRATVVAWESGQPESSARTMTLNGSIGTLEHDGKTTAMPPQTVAARRDHFYLYWVLTLEPLRDPGVVLTPLAEEGARGLKVERRGRPDVEIFFDRSWRPTHLRARVADPAGEGEILEELRFEGTVVSRGVRWPARIRIYRSGLLVKDLEVLEFAVS
jgi:hypothetical protein